MTFEYHIGVERGRGVDATEVEVGRERDRDGVGARRGRGDRGGEGGRDGEGAEEGSWTRVEKGVEREWRGRGGDGARAREERVIGAEKGVEREREAGPVLE
ncbi:hypothetical protein ACLOJK_013946 [Asimina triloba]